MTRASSDPGRPRRALRWARIPLGLVTAVLALVAGALFTLRTPWAGARLCDLAQVEIRRASGLPLSVRACRVDLPRLEVTAEGITLGAAAAPVFSADAVRARLARLQRPGRTLELAEVALVRPRVVARLPASDGAPAVCPPPALRRVRVERLEVREGAVDLVLPGGARVAAGRVDVRSEDPEGLLARVGEALAPRARLEVELGDVRWEDRARRVDVHHARARADLALDLSRLDVVAAQADSDGLSVAVAGRVDDLCRPRLDLAGAVSAELPALARLAGRPGAAVAGSVFADLQVSGPAAAPRVEADLRLSRVELGGWRPGDAHARLRFAGRELAVDALEVPATATGGRVSAHGVVRLGREVGLEAQATLDDVELGELLARLQLRGAWVTGRLRGELRVSGTASPLALRGEARLDLARFAALDRPWDRRGGAPAFLDLPRARLEGKVGVDRVGVHLQGVQLRAGRGALVTRGVLHFDGDRGFELGVDGDADLDELRSIAGLPLTGLAHLTGVSVRAAPYGEPRVAGRVAADGLRFLTLDLGRAEAEVSFRHPTLSFAGVEGTRGEARYRGDVAVDLGARPTRISSARYALEGPLRDLFGAVEPWLPSAARAREALEAPARVEGTADGPAGALDARFTGTLGAGTLLGRGFESGRFAGRIEGGARAVFDSVELRRGEGRVDGRGQVGFAAPFPWSFRAGWSTFPLEALGWPELAGAADGELTVDGSYEHPRVALAARGRTVRVLGVAVGEVGVEGRLDGEHLSATATGPGVKARGEARLAGPRPFTASADLDLDDVLRFAPGGPPAGLHADLRGTARIAGELRDPSAARGELRLDAVRIAYADFEVRAPEPVVFALEGGRIVVRRLELAGTNTALSLSGIREPSGALALDARGGVDLRLLGGALPGVTEPRGQLVVEAHVGGTSHDPVLVGVGRLREAGFTLRDLPVVVSGVGGQLAFSQNRVLFERLDGAVNGGRARLEGELGLRKLLPVHVRVGAELTEVPLRIPEWLPSAVTGRLEAAGTFDAMTLSGFLHVTRALYAQPVDLEHRLLEVPARRPPPKPYDRAGEWVALDIRLVVDGDARVDNDLVRGRVAGDLTLTGTLASVGMVGTLTLREGGRLLFRGNEFSLQHAVLDFVDRRRLRMSVDVSGEAQVNDYLVTLHLYGPWDDPKLQLGSQPSLSQRDIVTLLSLGYTARDTAVAGGVGGVATAAAAQALFSASGLDTQVRRFVPKNRLLKDFSVRITSAYSEASGQVEPRAELESRLLDERFRLRYQAPLANARGQHAEAEMRLGPHTALQYAWDNESPDVTSGGDHGVDLKLRWEWND